MEGHYRHCHLSGLRAAPAPSLHKLTARCPPAACRTLPDPRERAQVYGIGLAPSDPRAASSKNGKKSPGGANSWGAGPRSVVVVFFLISSTGLHARPTRCVVRGDRRANEVELSATQKKLNGSSFLGRPGKLEGCQRSRPDPRGRPQRAHGARRGARGTFDDTTSFRMNKGTLTHLPRGAGRRRRGRMSGIILFVLSARPSCLCSRREFGSVGRWGVGVQPPHVLPCNCGPDKSESLTRVLNQ